MWVDIFVLYLCCILVDFGVLLLVLVVLMLGFSGVDLVDFVNEVVLGVIWWCVVVVMMDDFGVMLVCFVDGLLGCFG